ncbi:hypothetical protein PF010_g31234 [Phytophthora fragariae]|nr:hypothetical protein PF010_g31234 [Phytophthora fragariae]KAE9064475.1 hypothetical protein PF007_g29187 [Phytophthora fragariae]KAE9168890.1 hypothetical protein PF002_g30500 [Phytophthora fragariae]KAE9169263.1 hypothetical protein PF004_g28239 [Phytophthora fragariae]KAE9267863.1 hypothetical protein PF001_g29903 [Phytophthora fragariae]
MTKGAEELAVLTAVLAVEVETAAGARVVVPVVVPTVVVAVVR